MSSSEEETSLIKTPQRPQGQGQDQGHSSSSSEKAKAERLRRQRELQAAFKERMREKETQKKQDEESQSILTASPVEQARTPKALYFMEYFTNCRRNNTSDSNPKYPILICDS